MIITVSSKKNEEKENKEDTESGKDKLTGLFSRERGEKLIRQYLKIKPKGELCALCIIDVDNFYEINDLYGSSADVVLYADMAYHRAIFHRRNDMLVEGADVVVAWYDGSRGGTDYTIRRAHKLGCRIINLFPDPQLSIDF